MRRITTRTAGITAGLLLAGSVLLGACGDDDSTDTDSPAATTGTTMTDDDMTETTEMTDDMTETTEMTDDMTETTEMTDDMSTTTTAG